MSVRVSLCTVCKIPQAPRVAFAAPCTACVRRRGATTHNSDIQPYRVSFLCSSCSARASACSSPQCVHGAQTSATRSSRNIPHSRADRASLDREHAPCTHLQCVQSAQRTDAVRESQTPTLAAGTFGNFRIAGDHPHTLGSFGTQLLSVVAPALHTPHRAASVSAGSGSACSGLATSSGQCTSRDTPAAARLAPVLTRPFETHGRVSTYLSQVHASKE